MKKRQQHPAVGRKEMKPRQDLDTQNCHLWVIQHDESDKISVLYPDAAGGSPASLQKDVPFPLPLKVWEKSREGVFTLYGVAVSEPGNLQELPFPMREGGTRAVAPADLGEQFHYAIEKLALEISGSGQAK